VPKPPMPISKEEKATAYLNVMSEINSRIRLIKSVRLSTLPYGMVRELCHLQLRHVCELIAIGCLIVQGDYTSSSVFSDEYNPSKIFRALEKLYEGFFPQPVSITTENNNIHYHANAKLSAITRKEIETLWGITGNYLHRLQIRKFLRADDVQDINFWPSIDEYVRKIETLLNPHGVPMHNPKMLVIAGLENSEGKPYLTLIDYFPNNQVSVQHFDIRGETPFWRSS